MFGEEYDEFATDSDDFNATDESLEPCSAEDLGSGEKAIELEVDETFPGFDLHELSSLNPEYLQWLRIVCLRVLALTPAVGKLKGRFGYSLLTLTRFLGFTNLATFARVHPIGHVQATLELQLQSWEKRYGTQCQFPPILTQNLDALSGLIGLTSIEREILGMAILIHAETVMDSLCEVIGTELLGHTATRIVAPMLRYKHELIAEALKRDAKLYTTGLLSIDMNGRFSLRQLIDLLTDSFAARMLTPLDDIRHLIEGFVKPVTASVLHAQDYEHIQADFKITRSLLANAVNDREKGVNILVYGKPGTGKTEFVRMLAAELKVQLMEISPNNLAGEPVTPIRRIRSFRVAQAFFHDQPTLLMFDECAEILQLEPFSLNEGDEAKVPRKSWINKMLESNLIPTIWITNSISGFDVAYLRRFCMCFEMPTPSQEYRLRMLNSAFQDSISPQACTKIAKSKDVLPALVYQAASMVKSIGAAESEVAREAMATHLINNKLKIEGKPQIILRSDDAFDVEEFKPGWMNTDVDLDALRQSLQDSGAGRICLYGPPGTGKTAFGKWVAQRLDRENMVVKASELISPFLGETESNIAQAFSQARQQRAILQFDEVDSFLQARQKATHQWEVTQVNEMLTQMENFDGIFIASTNLFENLDEASLRRFDMAIKIDFMKPEASCEMFIKTCEKLGISQIDPALEKSISQLRGLTPGDFEQVRRRSKLQPMKSADVVLRTLEVTVGQKKFASKAMIGFLNG